ncbi:MAG: protein kinase, partial [Gemmatimonadales bacterium]|nr:protein kinase [Gemmatimonadales bacterium]
MNPERWQVVESLVGVALETPVGERHAFLARACGADAALRAEVDSLLEAAASDPSFLDTPLVQLATLDADAVEAQPLRAGPWRIVAPIGRGGMAQVYLAQRDDGTFEQRVAVKVVRRGLDTADLLGRFHAERRILAALHHRNIARVLDAGALADGRPYLVMEHVEGEPITTWCATRAPT